jgi:hypothetical protein
MKSILVAGAAGLLAASGAAAQQQVAIDLTGLQIRNATNQSRSSAPSTISPAYRYHYVIDGMVQGQGFLSALSLLFPTPTPLAQVLETLSPGSSAYLSGDADNCSGAHPVQVQNQVLTGQTVISGITVDYNINFSFGIDGGNVASFSMTNVVLTPATLVGYLRFTSGTETISRVNYCQANCDGSTTPPILNVNDFTCFINKYAAGDSGANCDCSTVEPVLNVNDFTCFINKYAAGCP